MGYTSEHERSIRDRQPDQVTVARGSWFEVSCAALAIGITVFGVRGNQVALMAATATLVLGFGVFAHAGTIAARSMRPADDRGDLWGISSDLVAGLGAIVLGGLSFLGILQVDWLPIPALALGLGLVFAARAELGSEPATAREHCNAWMQVVVLLSGLGGMVFALVAFASTIPTVAPTLIALACVGVGLLFSAGGTLAIPCLVDDEA